MAEFIIQNYAWLLPLKDKKGITITNAFQKILDESKQKPNKTWVGKGCEFYNSSLKFWLQDSNIEIYSLHNEEKTVVAERFISPLRHLSAYDSSIKKFLY